MTPLTSAAVLEGPDLSALANSKFLQLLDEVHEGYPGDPLFAKIIQDPPSLQTLHVGQWPVVLLSWE